jgi:phytanoyl-CoA hydroxylase
MAERLDKARRNEYAEKGYIALPGLFSAAEVKATRRALSELMEGLLADARSGRASYEPPKPGGTGNYDGAWIRRPGRRVALLFERGYDPLKDPAALLDDVLAHVRKAEEYADDHPHFAEMATSPKIRGIASQLLGEPANLFQAMALIKPARIGSEKPWHQDNAYFKYAPLEGVVGFWLALDDAGVDNGCMHVLPGFHRQGGFKHIHDSDCRIPPERLRHPDLPTQGVPVELAAGGAMFFSGMLPHRTPPNGSDKPRWAIQLHYRGVSTRAVEQSEYDRLFAEPDGTPASCAAAVLQSTTR